ncbi:SUMO-activating enzyme subunit uba-2 [Sodiomyces alkalinus F11]|uniref:Ubiquitin-activating enzyme E1-like n=1 Tax=Sodiomyces alkalinus (strain CBS 110278 / VKM F-3762 / F11) TaxID=1314773 RepID=A0A3N2Q6I3_SODAK|nr:SUMO-activating enzyme subunit uba-2 [Sodiomyces alkalinus F11]ROT42350.1 SUMO-activating enzyme subunit uba-2 [Sodiomyces alkalinus F11]
MDPPQTKASTPAIATPATNGAGAGAPAPPPSSTSTQTTPAGTTPPARALQRQRPAPKPRDKFYFQSLGPSATFNVKQARVLMVGAGGIGCELLKNLVLTGFGEIEVVDLDTIDLSNLNRQFLFRHEHIKKSKALVAKEAAQAFNPQVNIVAHHANIKDSQFNVRWFRGFTLVFNALDNLEARRHVNWMCLAADVPLIESGTTGFNGNVQVIKKGVTACYDCTEKPVPKSFPVCTIRSTPSQPIHCIVWGKSYLLSEVFGASEDEAAYDHSEDADNAAEIVELKKEAAALREIRESLGTGAFPQLLFDKVFNADIVRLASMEDVWKSRKKPQPLDYRTLLERSSSALASKEQILRDDQRCWSLEENLVVFIDSLDRLSKRMLELKKAHQGASGPEPVIEFDKDDVDTLDFVAAAANIRSAVFGIEPKSRFDIKEMAGNIIPAIATTNAIVASLSVLQAFKVLRGEFQQTKELFLAPSNLNRLIGYTRYSLPNPDCPVCSVYQTSVFVDLSKATLNDLVDDFVRLQLGYGDKEFAVSNELGPLYDPEETENLPKKLSELGIKGDTYLTVIDEDDEDPFVNVVINIEEATDLVEDKPIKAVAADQKPQIPRRPKKVQPVAVVANGTAPQLNGKRRLEPDAAEPSTKRRRSASEAEEPQAKKAKTAPSGRDDVIVIDDDETGQGVVVLDD